MAQYERKTIEFEEGWEFMQRGITKLKDIVEGRLETPFSRDEKMMLYA